MMKIRSMSRTARKLRAVPRRSPDARRLRQQAGRSRRRRCRSRFGDAGQRPGLRRQCRRPRVLRYRPDRSVGRRAASRSTSRPQWLQQYPRYQVTIEGHADERGTREYNIALGARRATNVKNYLVSRGINPSPHPHDLLRQGTPGRGLQRHFLLVAEPPRRHGAQQRTVTGRSHHTDWRNGGLRAAVSVLRPNLAVSEWPDGVKSTVNVGSRARARRQFDGRTDQ